MMSSSIVTSTSVVPRACASEPALVFAGVSKRYSAAGVAIRALSEVSFAVPRASIVGVIGMSGAGKSTVFRCASALERPDAGTIRVAGQDLAALTGASLREARKRVGLVFQQLHLAPSRTALENVALPLELTGTAPGVARDRARELLAWVGLEHRAGSHPKNLSGGQRQRVAVARALAASPDLLLCDEPTSALDPETTRSVSDLLLRVRDELGVAVLLISHEMLVVRRICNRVVLLQEGRVVDDGPTAPVLDAFELESAVRRVLRDSARALEHRAPLDHVNQETSPWTTTRH
ncbi:MAG: transporter ATP-binding protein [Labilithrix sp.]|nr:transporter ATP-binding protein [Labilithrix sp.]